KGNGTKSSQDRLAAPRFRARCLHQCTFQILLRIKALKPDHEPPRLPHGDVESANQGLAKGFVTPWIAGLESAARIACNLVFASFVACSSRAIASTRRIVTSRQSSRRPALASRSWRTMAMAGCDRIIPAAPDEHRH